MSDGRLSLPTSGGFHGGLYSITAQGQQAALVEDRPVNPPIRYTRHHPITEVFFDGYVDSSELDYSLGWLKSSMIPLAESFQSLLRASGSCCCPLELLSGME